MSKVPLRASTMPAGRSCPSPASAAATNVNVVPATVTWFGVMGSRPSSRAIRWALRLTHAWKRVVNTRVHLLVRLVRSASGAGAPRLLVDLDHPPRNGPPPVPLRLGQPGLAQPPPQQLVPGEDRQRRAELDGALRTHRLSVHASGDHRQVARD